MNIEDKIDGLSEEIAQVSKIAAEMGKTKADLNTRHWRIAAIILLALLLLTNGFWIAYASQFEKVVDTTETVTTTTTFEDIVADANDGSNINFAGGDINGG